MCAYLYRFCVRDVGELTVPLLVCAFLRVDEDVVWVLLVGEVVGWGRGSAGKISGRRGIGIRLMMRREKVCMSPYSDE